MTLACGVGLLISQFEDDAKNRMRGRQKYSFKNTLRDLLNFILSNKMIIRVMMIVMVIGLIGTRSRAGNSIFFLAVLITAAVAMVAYRSGPSSLKKTLSTFFTSIVVLDVLIFGAFVGVDKVVDRLQATKITNAQALQTNAESVADGKASTKPINLEETLEARVSPAYAALNVLKEKPFFGTGGKTFQWVFPAYKDETAVGLHYEHAHNDFIEYAVEGGVVGFGVLVLMALCVLGQGIRTVFIKFNTLFKGVAIGLLAGLVMTLVHCAVDFPSQIFAIAMSLSVMGTTLLSISIIDQKTT